jgi:hypothetical protein
MSRPPLEVADIFNRYGNEYRQTHGTSMHQQQWQVMNAIERCRTSAFGGHVEQCQQCQHKRNAYNSCRNRHCPKCQRLQQAQWVDERQTALLPVEYFHVVFTLPEPVAAIALQNKRVLYNLLFRATAETLRTIAADPKHLGGEIGFIGVLHTWGQNLSHHPHLHCIVPGGGLSQDQARWVSCRPGFFLSVRVLSRLFRRLFLEGLQQAFKAKELQFHAALDALNDPQAFAAHLRPLFGIEWVVYAKPPFGGPEQVLRYLGRYTHRIAIANHRLIGAEDGQVTFHWKDYRHNNKQKTMTLSAGEFIRRFLLHVLPKGLQRIRHYGLLGNRFRQQKLTLCRALLDVAEPPQPEATQAIDYRTRFEMLTGRSLLECPHCKEGKMAQIAILKRPPRVQYIDTS